MVEIKTVSSNKDTLKAIRQAKHKFKIVSKDNSISFANKNIGAKVANMLLNDIETNYNEFVSGLTHDHQDRSGTHFYKEFENTGYRIVATGKQIIYDEFGTGDEGMLRPHPEKERYNLNPYGSGEHIKTDKKGFHYWTYMDNSGNFATTRGVRSGRFIYDALDKAWSRDAAYMALDSIRTNNKKAMKGK